MRKLSVTEYLIERNQGQQVGPTIYMQLGDAINAIAHAAQVTPDGQEPISIEHIADIEPSYGFTPDGAQDMASAWQIGCYAVIGYIYAWRMTDSRIIYTAESTH